MNNYPSCRVKVTAWATALKLDKLIKDDDRRLPDYHFKALTGDQEVVGSSLTKGTVLWILEEDTITSALY